MLVTLPLKLPPRLQHSHQNTGLHSDGHTRQDHGRARVPAAMDVPRVQQLLNRGTLC